jgi:hypothetical protein
MEIRPNPNLPPEIKEASDQGKLVVFLGAGISRLTGCPGWDDLANQLIAVALKENDKFHLGIDHQIADTIKQLPSNKHKIAAVYGLYQEQSKDDYFLKEVLATKIDPIRDPIQNLELYTSIKNLNAYSVTTNADIKFNNVAQKFFQSDFLCNEEEFKTDPPKKL